MARMRHLVAVWDLRGPPVSTGPGGCCNGVNGVKGMTISSFYDLSIVQSKQISSIELLHVFYDLLRAVFPQTALELNGVLNSC